MLRSLLKHAGHTDYRTFSVTAAQFEQIAHSAGLRCTSQELINWHSHRLSDCLSTFTRRGSRWSGPNRIRRNSDFIDEARQIKESAL